MKALILSFALIFATAACSAEKPAEPAKPVATATAEKEEPRTKRVCKDVVQNGKPVLNKDGTVKQECRTIKIHKKHEGTKVPAK